MLVDFKPKIRLEADGVVPGGGGAAASALSYSVHRGALLFSLALGWAIAAIWGRNRVLTTRERLLKQYESSLHWSDGHFIGAMRFDTLIYSYYF